MLIYSKTSVTFLKKVKTMARFILNNEMGLEFKTTRFKWRGYLYPLHFVVFEDPKKLGYFNSHNYQLGLHKKLMYLAKDEVIENIIRHELAHLYTFLTQGERFNGLAAHGSEFQEVCQKFGWATEVSRAYSNIEEDNALAAPNLEFEKVREKIVKLLALSSSDNPHEAELATLKANDYLLKYNLTHSALSLENSECEEAVVKTILTAKRMNAKLNALYDILQYFYVQPVFNRANGSVSLDVVGNRLNADTADYVAAFLDKEFERLWLLQKKKSPELKGQTMKNSFIRGLGQGFTLKLKKERDLLFKGRNSNDLIILNQALQRQVEMAFPRLSRQSAGQSKACPKSQALGKSIGEGLSIRPGVSKGNTGHLIEIF